MKKELFDELLESVKQAAAIERGTLKPARVFVVKKKRSDECAGQAEDCQTPPKNHFASGGVICTPPFISD